MLNELLECLQALLGLHRQLLDLVRREREALVNLNSTVVEECTLAKQELIDQMGRCESRRGLVTAQIAAQLKRPYSELTLGAIIIAIQGDDLKKADALRSVQNALRILTERIAAQNLDNGRLIESSLTHIQAMKRNVLGEAKPKSQTYTAQGQRSVTQAEARLISQEA